MLQDIREERKSTDSGLGCNKTEPAAKIFDFIRQKSAQSE